MPIQHYTASRPPVRPMRIVKYPPAVYVRMLGTPDQCLKLWLHKRGTHSYPCLGDECIDCGDDRFPYGYAPVQVGRWTGVEFIGGALGILPVTPLGLDLCIVDLVGKVIKVSRHPQTTRGQTVPVLVEPPFKATPCPPCFDVLPHMQAVWAWFRKCDGNAEAPLSYVRADEHGEIAGRIGGAA